MTATSDSSGQPVGGMGGECGGESTEPAVGGVLGGPSGVLLYTPAQAAELLQVPESWLRRQAGQRAVPCRMVGKHLRFARSDLEALVLSMARPARVSVPERARTRRRC